MSELQPHDRAGPAINSTLDAAQQLARFVPDEDLRAPSAVAAVHVLPPRSSDPVRKRIAPHRSPENQRTAATGQLA